jgi:hypothetical protein
MKEGKVQFKLVVDEQVRDIVREHAAQNGTDMSTTVSTVVREVLFEELDVARQEAVKTAASL